MTSPGSAYGCIPQGHGRGSRRGTWSGCFWTPTDMPTELAGFVVAREGELDNETMAEHGFPGSDGGVDPEKRGASAAIYGRSAASWRRSRRRDSS